MKKKKIVAKKISRPKKNIGPVYFNSIKKIMKDKPMCIEAKKYFDDSQKMYPDIHNYLKDAASALGFKPNNMEFILAYGIISAAVQTMIQRCMEAQNMDNIQKMANGIAVGDLRPPDGGK